MTALWALASEYREAAQKLADLDLDEQTIADTLESLSGDLEVKAQNIGMMVRALEADAAAIDEWAKQAKERASAMRSRAGRMHEYLSDTLLACGIKRISGPGIELSWRKSTRVVIDDEEMIADRSEEHTSELQSPLNLV